MSRIYATEEDSGRRFLVRLECDEPGCSEKLLPGPSVSESGWVKVGEMDRGTSLEWDYCQEHAPSIARRGLGEGT